MRALAEALCGRLPGLATVLDAEHARAVVEAHRDAAGPVPEVTVGDVLYRDDGSVSLRYRAAGGPTLLVHVPGDGTAARVRPFPHDPDLPTLPEATTPRVAAGVLQRVVPEVGGERGSGRCAVEVVHHPRAGACVLRYHLHPGAGGDAGPRHRTVYARVHRDARSAQWGASVLHALGPSLAGRAAGPVALPRPLGVSDRLRANLTEALPGEALPLLLRRPEAAGAAVRAAGEVLAALHAHRVQGAVPVHRLTDELVRLRGDLAVVRRVWPDLADRVVEAVAPALRAAGSGTPGPPVVSHGDYTPSQVLLSGRGTALVDLDTACWAEPAADAGRFLAYLDAAAARWPGAGRDATGERFLAAYEDAGGGGGPDGAAFFARVDLYRSVSLARMALRAARQLKDRRVRVSVALLEGAEPDAAGRADGRADAGRPQP